MQGQYEMLTFEQACQLDSVDHNGTRSMKNVRYAAETRHG